MPRLVVLASGRGSNLEALHARITERLVSAELVALVTDRPGAACVDVAARHGIPCTALPRRRGEDAAAYDSRLAGVLEALRPELVVLAGFMRILGPRVLDAFPARVVNLHPSLLPAYPGANAVRAALQGGARITGCTTHIVTQELDAGPILLQAAVPVHADDTEERLASRVHALEHQVLPRTVQLFAEDRVLVEAGRARILPGPSWRQRVPAVEGALYGEGY